MATKPKDRFRIFECHPAQGGALVTRGSLDNCGIYNYSVKRDWWRDLDVEARRVGCDYFWPNLDLPVGGQPFPGLIVLDSLTYVGGAVTATRAMGNHFENGETVIIGGADQPEYNGEFPIFNVTRTTFQYAPASTPSVTPATTTTQLTASPVEEINLIALARRPNCKTAVIAGSPRRLYRYYSLEELDYISLDPADYPPGTPPGDLHYWYEDPDCTIGPGGDYPTGTLPALAHYVDNNPGYWIVIGSGYSTTGRRWEAVNINGYLVFNNSVDLPCTYRVEDTQVVPIYELREQGIAAVGTISEINGILVLGDLREIVSTALSNWFNTAGRIHIDTLTNAAGVAQATISAGHSFQVGDRITISGAVGTEYDGDFIITARTGTTFDYVIAGAPASPDPSSFIYVRFTNNAAAYGVYTDASTLTRTKYRVAWSMPGEPRRFAPIYRGSMLANDNVLSLSYPPMGLVVGENVTVQGAGASHAGGTADNLSGNIVFINGASIVLDTFAQTTTGPTNVQATDAIGSIVGYEDLQDDGSAVLKMLPLADQLIIYKETNIYLAQYIGLVDQPFAFSPRRIQKEQGLYYRNTLAFVETPGDMFHIYAGRNSFYRFDLTTQQPLLLPHFESMSDLFYSRASLADTERIFACENGITHEILFVLPHSSYQSDQAICWDYKQDTIATTSLEFTAGATVRKPIAGIASGPEEDWFVMGTARGVVIIYGKTNEAQLFPDWDFGKEIYFRRYLNPYSSSKIAYDSVIKSGLIHFGIAYWEKDVRSLVTLVASQSPPSAFTVNVYGAQNVNGVIDLVGTETFSNPEEQTLMPLSARRYYFQHELVITGVDNPDRLVGWIWDAAPVISRSLGRG